MLILLNTTEHEAPYLVIHKQSSAHKESSIVPDANKEVFRQQRQRPGCACDTKNVMRSCPLLWVGTLSRVIKVYQEMYQNSQVYPCIAMYTYV